MVYGLWFMVYGLLFMDSFGFRFDGSGVGVYGSDFG